MPQQSVKCSGVASLRSEMKLSRVAFARAANVSVKTVYNWEVLQKGSPSYLRDAAKALGVAYERLLRPPQVFESVFDFLASIWKRFTEGLPRFLEILGSVLEFVQQTRKGRQLLKQHDLLDLLEEPNRPLLPG